MATSYEKLKIIGVTGTNGKTTITTLLFKLFHKLGYSVALISTVENRINNKVYKTDYTTPPPDSLNKFLRLAVKKGVRYVFMECSSHGIVQNRIAGLKFTGGIFTNLTQDHLDYHGTMKKYAEAKKKFFDQLPETSFALSNRDDKHGKYMLKDTHAWKYFYSLKSRADFKKNIETKLLGKFNKYNVLAVYATATLLGLPKNRVGSILKNLKPPTGRLEVVRSRNGILGVVDYAHTPDALKNAIKTLRENLEGGRLITIVGCGGDRDKSKRPIMGQITNRMSDYTIFTSDNPRSEDPDKILSDIIRDLPRSPKFEVEKNRSKAIQRALKQARRGDIVLVAGKGHENYQILGNKKIHFSDREELEKAFRKKK